MRGTQLSDLRAMLKAEIGDHLTVGTSNDAAYNLLFSNKQKFYESIFDWPFLETRQDVNIQAGQRYFAFPLINLERPIRAEIAFETHWYPVDYDIQGKEFNVLDSDRGEVANPVLRWTLHDQIELGAPDVTTMAGAGTLGGELFNYKVTYVVPEGETVLSTAVEVAGVDPPNVNPISLTGIPRDLNLYATARRIYRSKNGAPNTYYLLATLSGNSSTTYTDTTPDSLLTSAAPTKGTANVTVFEVWPVGDASVTLRFTGRRVLRDLVNDTDNADLDDILLVLSVAGDRLLLLRHPAAPTMVGRAQARLASIRASYPVRTRNIIVGGGYPERKRRPVFVGPITAGGDQLKQYDVDPNLEGILPGNINQPAYAYQRNGAGPTFTWNTTTHIWQ